MRTKRFKYTGCIAEARKGGRENMKCEMCHLEMPKGITDSVDCPYCKAKRERQDPFAHLRELAEKLPKVDLHTIVLTTAETRLLRDVGQEVLRLHKEGLL